MLSLCPHSLPVSAAIPLARGAVELLRSYSLERKIQVVLQRESCFVGKAHDAPFHVTGGIRQIEGVSVWGLKPLICSFEHCSTASIMGNHALCPLAKQQEML